MDSRSKPVLPPILLLLALSAIPSVQANTQFSREPGSCDIEGDADVYGIGIRLSYYLQLLALIATVWIDPTMAKGIRVTTNILSIVLFVNTIRGANVDNSLMVVEWYIVQYLVFFMWIFNFPTTFKSMVDSTGSMACYLLINASVGVVTLWLYFKGTLIGAKEGCDVKVFFFTSFSAYAPQWITFNKVWGVFLTLTTPCAIIGAICIVSLKIIKWNKVDYNPEAAEKVSVIMKGMQIVFLLVFGAVSIGFTEMTLVVNNIAFPDVRLTDSGQFVPFLIGIFSLSTIAWEGFRKLFRRDYADRDPNTGLRVDGLDIENSKPNMDAPAFESRPTSSPPPLPNQNYTNEQRALYIQETVSPLEKVPTVTEVEYDHEPIAPMETRSIHEPRPFYQTQSLYGAQSMQEIPAVQEATTVHIRKISQEELVHDRSTTFKLPDRAPSPPRKLARQPTPYVGPGLASDYAA